MLIGFGIADEDGKRTAEETEVKPEAQIVEKEAFLAPGVRYEGENKQGEIRGVWEKEFLPRMGELDSIMTDRRGL
jgi:hypothetical protein